MAKVFKVYGTVQYGAAVAEWPWSRCVEVLNLHKPIRTEDRPKFGDRDTTPWPSHIGVYLEAEEAASLGIKPGYFVSPLHPDNVRHVLSD